MRAGMDVSLELKGVLEFRALTQGSNLGLSSIDYATVHVYLPRNAFVAVGLIKN